MEKKELQRLAVVVVATAIVGGAAGALLRVRQDHSGTVVEAKSARYQCPMHPTYTSDRPGDCPICGMKLVPIGEATAASPAAAGPADRSTIALTDERRRMLGVRSVPVARAALDREVRTVGRLAVDERRLHHVHVRFDGYIEHLHVDFMGAAVRRGQALASIYSPELVATQQEYLLALRAQKELGRSSVPSVASGGVDLLNAAHQRLLLFGVSATDIATLATSGKVKRTVDVHSEVTGYVVQKMAQHGMRVTPADTLFDIADLSHLWVIADVYDADLAFVSLGMEAELSVAGLPGHSWRAKVTNVAPVMDEKTRTIKVRLEVDNREGLLKPEMFADVVLRSRRGTGLVVPESAVLHSGEQKLVFVDRADGHLEPRQVRLGARLQQGHQVLSGVAEGERVVVSANFLLDSESSLKAALANMSPAPPEATPATAEPHRH